MEDLPYIDEHSTQIEAARDQAWRALTSVLRTDLAGGPQARFAGLLRVVPSQVQGDWREEINIGDSLPGFEVSEAQAPERLALRGKHRFSHYALVFELDETGPNRCTVRAQTWAEFPGATGRIYRAFVIGTRGHRVIIRHLLRDTARRA